MTQAADETEKRPEIAILANPGLDLTFDRWYPTVTNLIMGGAMIVVTGHTATDAWTDAAESAQAIMELCGARIVVPRTRCKLYTRTPKLTRELPFYQMKKKGFKPEKDARKLGDADVFAENGFYFVCQGVDLRKCPADDKLPMGTYEEMMAKKHVGAYVCKRAADLENRPRVAEELRTAAQKLDWGTKGWDEKRSFTAEDFLCQMSPRYHKARIAFREAA